MSEEGRIPFNLIQAPWLPMQRRSGCVEWLSPAAIVDDHGNDAVVGFAWGRPDFDAAAAEFMIGLLTTALAPKDDADWRRLWRVPPTRQELAERFAPFAPYFDLDGAGPRFLQDSEELADAEEKSIGGLLIDAPGDKTISDNTDHFVKRGQVPVLGRAAAAMALFTLQAYAPEGGRGYRTSLRGGGPLTTLVEDRDLPTLWQCLWLAVEDRGSIDSRNAAGGLAEDARHVFPWTVPTRTSDPKARGRDTTPADVHALQVYWGMPCRIRLIFEPSDERHCALTGQTDCMVVSAYRTKNYGTNYTAGFRHPLTPHYRVKEAEPWRPVHGQPGGIGFRNWLGFLVESGDPQREPAASVTAALRRRDGHSGLRLVARGYYMKKAKPCGFANGAMPIIGLTDRERRERVQFLAKALVLATDQAARLLIGTLKVALFGKRAEAKGDLSFHGERLWRECERRFYDTLFEASRLDIATGDVDLRRNWRLLLHDAALVLFDEIADMDAIDVVSMARVVGARRNLASGLRGYGKSGQALFRALGVPPPQARSRRVKGDGTAASEATP